MIRGPLRLAAVPVVASVVLAGVWVAGGAVTDDARLAKTLTGAWFALAGMIAAAVALRWRPLAVPVLATWFTTAAAAGGFLLVTSSVDRVVDEHVVVATAAPPGTAGAAESTPAQGPALVASGRFRSRAHPTRGVASLVQRPGGGRVLTLTRFVTSPGPDLRLLLLPPGGGVGDAVDLGGLRGNKGDQQYAVPASVRAGAVVIWCRAFSVGFGSASLRAAG